MNAIRRKRIEAEIHRELSSYILNGTIKDHRVSTFLSITEVKISSDMAFAKIFVSSFNDKIPISQGLEGLNSAQGYMRNLLKKKLSIKIIPHLTFYADDSVKKGIELNEKITKLSTNT